MASIPDFPSNNKFTSNDPEKPATEKPDLKVVESGTATLKKQSMGKRLKSLMFNGDIKASAQQVFLEILVPEAKTMILEGLWQIGERAFFGETRGRRISSTTRSRVNGILGGIVAGNNATNYNSLSRRDDRDRPPMGLSSLRSRSSTEDLDIVLPDRRTAEAVLDKMHEVLAEYDVVTLANLYEIIGESFHHVDENWGWTDLTGSRARRLNNGGYVLVLPPQESLKQR